MADDGNRSIKLPGHPCGHLLDRAQRLVVILPVPGEVDGDDFEAAASQPARLVSPPGAVLASSVDEDYQPWLDRSPRRRSASRWETRCQVCSGGANTGSTRARLCRLPGVERKPGNRSGLDVAAGQVLADWVM